MKSSNHIIELWFIEGKWNNHNLMSDTLAPPAYSGSAGDPSVYECRYDNSNSLHVIYNDDDEEGNIHELWRENGKWSHNNLTKTTGTAPKAKGKPYGYVWEKDKSQHVVYQDKYGGIHELWHKEGSWKHNNLTQITNAPPAESDPKGYVLSTSKEGQTQHIVYYGKDRYYHELRYTNGNWSYFRITPTSYMGCAEAVLETLQFNSYTELWSGDFWMQPWGLPHPWLAYNTLESLIDYTQITGDQRYIPVIKDVAGSGGLFRRTKGAGNDDVGWAGIAFVKAYILTQEKDYITKAKEAYKQLIDYWDDRCQGGVYWDLQRGYKNAITNALFLMLATMMYLETKEKDYLDWALKEWTWFNDSGLIDLKSTPVIYDGFRDTETCEVKKERSWTYIMGVILGGLTNLWRITNNMTYIEKANQIANAVLDSTEYISQGILKEGGESFHNPNEGGVSFKGTFMRYLAYLAYHEPNDKAWEKQKYKNFIWSNANYVWNNARSKEDLMIDSTVPFTTRNIIYPTWIPNSGSTTEYGAVAQSSGLDLFNAAMRLV